MLLEVAGGRIGLPPAQIVDPLLPDPVAAARRHARRRACGSTRASRAAGAACSPLPRVVVSDPLGLATRVVTRGRRPAADELLVLPRIEPVVAAPGGGDAARITRRAAARRWPPRSSSTACASTARARRPSRIYWPALARGAGLMERRLRAEPTRRPARRPRPARRRARGGPRRRRPRRGVARASRSPGPAAAASCCPATAARPSSTRRSRAGRTCTRAWRSSGRGSGPALASVAQPARAGRLRRAARARRGRRGRSAPAPARAAIVVVPGALPGRRATFSVAGCTRLRARAAPAAGRAAAAAEPAGRRRGAGA